VETRRVRILCTCIIDEIDQEELARLAQPGELTFLEFDIDVLMALYSDNTADFKGDLTSFFNAL
jgi:hypothetical protein